MDREEKAEVDGTVAKRELVVKSDWITAVVALIGTAFILFVTARQLIRLSHGRFGSGHLAHQGIFDRVFVIYAIFLAVLFVLKIKDRVLRFAFGLLGSAILMELIASVFLDAVPSILVPALFLLRLAGFLFLSFEAIRWFKRNMKVE